MIVNGYETNNVIYKCGKCDKKVVVKRHGNIYFSKSSLFEDEKITRYELKQYNKKFACYVEVSIIDGCHTYDFSPKRALCEDCYNNYKYIVFTAEGQSAYDFKNANNQVIEILKSGLFQCKLEYLKLIQLFDDITKEVLSGLNICDLAESFIDDLHRSQIKRLKMLKKYFHKHQSFYLHKLKPKIYYHLKFQRAIQDLEFSVRILLNNIKISGHSDIFIPITIKPQDADNMFYIRGLLCDIYASDFFALDDRDFHIKEKLIFARLQEIYNI